MSELLEEIEEIIDYAKGNFLPTSNLLKHALVAAKMADDKDFAEFILKELKGYKSGVLPPHRRVQGEVVIPPPYGNFQRVNLDGLDADERLKVSTAHVVEPVHIIESTLDLRGDEGVFVVAFSPENESVLPQPPHRRAEYAILLVNARLKEMLDDVRTTVLDWAINLQRERARGEVNAARVEEPPAKDESGSRLKFLSANKHWMFEGIGTEAVKALGVALLAVVGLGGGGLLLWNRQSDDGRANKSEGRPANAAPTLMPTPEPAATVGKEDARAPAKYTFEQLRAMLEGKSKAEVKKLLGNPFDVSDYGGGKESWSYVNIAYDPLTGKVATITLVSFDNGKVEQVSFG